MTRDTRTPPRGRFAWRSPQHWSLRVKFSVVLLVPLLLAVTLGVLRIADQTAEADERDRVARFVGVQGVVSSLIVDVERERYRAAEFVANGRVDDRALRRVIESVDHRAAQSQDAVAGLHIDDVAGLDLVRRQAAQALERLPGLREVVTGSTAPATTVISRYSQLLEQLVQLDRALLRNVNTAEVLGLANSLAGIDAARNEATLQQAQLAIAVRGRLSAPLAADLQYSGARLSSGLAEFRVALDAAQRVRYGGLIAGSANAQRATLVESVLAAGGAGEGVDVVRVADVYSRFLGELDAAGEGVRAELRITAAERRQSAIAEAWINVTALIVALLLAAAIVGFVARAMLAALRTLRRSAILVAQERLPEAVQRMRQGSVPNVDVNPVPVVTREEVGQVARAFDAVHAQAVRLAAEQATLQNNVNAMYVNLSRRSQSLVDRQLLLIEQLEAGEVDPEQLSDLFRLDHLATRMRRNCENLLVLAGTEVERDASDPMPVLDVLRAAVSEIEQYARVTVQTSPDAVFVGEAANDIQHLLAELLDNATKFSPPDTQVVMSCSQARDDSILVEIFDSGPGMSAGELATLNARLRNPSEATATVAASQQMGLFVVGKLANRHGVWVGLFTDSMGPSRGASAEGRAHGVTARVTVPADLVGEREGEPDQVLWSRFEAAPPLPARIVIPDGTDGGRRAPAGAWSAPLAEQDSVGAETLRLPVVPAQGAPVPVPVPAAPRELDGAALFEPLVPPSSLPDPEEPRPRDPFAGASFDDADATPIFAEVTSGWFHVTSVPAETATEVIPVAVGARGPDPASFATAADSLWQAARAATNRTEDGVTKAGLPKRVPRNRLLPGNAGPAGPTPSGPARDADAIRGRLTTFQRGIHEGRVNRAGGE
ncbi:nitrate- and nitrite sensing domain-containing protein [Pseudonocardia kunmingensis]|uniref:histidine kinase n=1 Tax=Pseudonocardia kunmingensis TaxID=630975 RepID=A0A543D3M5_9PSEU|nr:nitrate- and nitrite sensing domain-containing protein [Pseudonocardia kunmingensis]TQM03935.1 HAMP domain-containing protein [Pseudonocardia kunmingensis]